MIEKLVVGPMYTNCYIFAEEKSGVCYLIDPGGDADEIAARTGALMVSRDLKPRGIVLTHGHLDHIAGVSELFRRFSSREEPFHLAVHEKDKDYLGAAAEETHKRSFNHLGIMGTEYFKTFFSEPPEPDILLSEGEYVPETGLRILHTPGHTPGSICLYHEQEKILFSGDTLFCRGMGRTDLPGGDGTAIAESIQKKLFLLPEDVAVYPGHGPESTIGNEKKNNPFFR